MVFSLLGDALRTPTTTQQQSILGVILRRAIHAHILHGI